MRWNGKERWDSFTKIVWGHEIQMLRVREKQKRTNNGVRIFYS